MDKCVILITGTPCTGKTTTAKQLTSEINAHYINLTEYSKTHGLTLGEDIERKTTIIDEQKMRDNLSQTIKHSNKTYIVVDGHYAAAVIEPSLVTYVFVLRRNPKDLKKQMEACGFEGTKLWENLSAEILDVCLSEAISIHAGKVCELDVTGKTVKEVTNEVLEVLKKGKKCYAGYVDWLTVLEREGLTDQYLKA
jgi:adenylate kinase